MAESEIDYARLLQRALRGVVQAVLTRTAAEGLPGEHHFYLTLRLDSPGVQVPPFLRQRYPEELTVVLQHQFQDLHVDGDGFAVTLRFDGMPARMVIPWDAVTAFFDPTAEFGLRFDVVELAGKGGKTAGPRPQAAPAEAASTGPKAVERAAKATVTALTPAEQPEASESAAEAAAGEGENGKVLTFGRPRDKREDE